MGKDHKEIILTLARKWRAILLEETEILSNGNLEKFDKLTKESVQIQARLDDMLSKIDPASLGKEILDLMGELQEHNANLVAELTRGRKELSVRIGTLRKNKTSLKGYKQKKKAAPRFMNERT